jgi:signal transduction histidine kinase
MLIRDFFDKNRVAAQLTYGVILIILIPLLIAFNTVFIIKKYNRSIDFILQKQALVLGRAVSVLMKSDLPWEYFIQVKLEALIESNNEIEELTVLIPEGDNFRILASTQKDQINTVRTSYFYKYAWLQPENSGLATDSFRLVQTVGDDELASASDNNRFWLVAIPMKDVNDKKSALLAIKLSSEIVDDLTSYNRNMSVYLLIGTVFVVILFLMIAVRLWDYALLYQKTKEIDRMKDEFISMASHELRTPVTGIRGYSSMILDGSMGKINEKMKKGLKMINGSAERLNVLVADLLDVGKIEQERISLDLKPLDVSPIIYKTIEELNVESDKKSLNLEYKPHISPLPKIEVDRDRFEQIMINLISNAVKYTQTGGIEIMTRERYNNKALEIMIKDTGIGMSAESRKRLFEKFYRVRNDKTQGITGTGLGLWITKRLVELMQGTIAVDSIESVGTQVTIQFPIKLK